MDKWPYQAIAGDSIRIVRSAQNWTTHNKVVFYSGDSIRIGDFIPSDAAVYPPEFGDAVLKRRVNDKLKTEMTGYVVGYETCGLSPDNRKAKGYIVISEDLKDTLAVYGLPEIFEFPAEVFSKPVQGLTIMLNMAFPEKFRYAFKMQFTYTLSSEEELIDRELKAGCAYPAIYMLQETYRNCVPVIINSATKEGTDNNIYPVEIKPVLIGKGEITNLGGFSVPNRVITSVDEWNELKTSMRNRVYVCNTFDESDIDFSAYQVIAIFDEIHGNGGWSIDITGIVEYSDKIIVSVTHLETGGLTSVFTQPYHIVRIPVSAKEIVFEFQ
jgi:hypothetical protein